MNVAQYHLHRLYRVLRYRRMTAHQELLAQHALAPLAGHYLPWSGASMSASAVVSILNEVVVNGRRSIVECGSGLSTIYLGRLLRYHGGQLESIEHDPEWADVVHNQLRAEGLEGYVSMVLAPLEESSLAASGAQWYAEDRLRELTGGRKIDMLVVDGPPAYDTQRRFARYPAVPFFQDQLADHFTVMLHDITRRGEQEIVRRWEQETGLRFQRRFGKGNLAIARRGPGFLV